MHSAEVKKRFGVQVRRRRTDLGLSQEQLAEKANLHRTYVSDVEAGKRNPSLESIQRLVQALGVSIGEVFMSLEEPPGAVAIATSRSVMSSEAGEAVADILLVEDDPKDVELALLAFRAAKIANRVHVVRDGAEALDYLFARGDFKRRSGSPQLVLLDMNLPKIQGLEVLRRIKADERTSKIPVVILSVSRRDDYIEEAVRLGAEGYMVKPMDFQNFMRLTPKLSLQWALVKPTAKARARSES
jgi:CheY-like chemotaxis protein